MNAKEAVEMIREYENHVWTINRAEEKFREMDDDYMAGELWAVGQSLSKRIEELNERLESASI